MEAVAADLEVVGVANHGDDDPEVLEAAAHPLEPTRGGLEVLVP
jgi:hypothetical protein